MLPGDSVAFIWLVIVMTTTARRGLGYKASVLTPGDRRDAFFAARVQPLQTIAVAPESARISRGSQKNERLSR